MHWGLLIGPKVVVIDTIQIELNEAARKHNDSIEATLAFTF